MISIVVLTVTTVILFRDHFDKKVVLSLFFGLLLALGVVGKLFLDNAPDKLLLLVVAKQSQLTKKKNRDWNETVTCLWTTNRKLSSIL